ncbi:MAG: aminoglycoside phosphotransferase family protein [Pseudomonadota bacterium]
MTDPCSAALNVTVEQAQRLVQDQFRHLAHRPLTALPSAGTDNHIFRLGDDLLLRFPKVTWAIGTPERESRILPHWQGHTLKAPHFVALGAPGEGYPHVWSILHWIDGMPLTETALTAPARTAVLLAQFIRAQRARPAADSLEAGPDNHYRGAALRARSAPFNTALETLADEIDTKAARRVWARSLDTPEPTRAVWLHGDLHAGNLLVEDGELAGVIDFGLAGIGDGACDLQPAWAIFDGPARAAFREALGATQAEWLRGMGWTLSIACIALAHYRETKSPLSDMSRRTISRLFEDMA